MSLSIALRNSCKFRGLYSLRTVQQPFKPKVCSTLITKGIPNKTVVPINFTRSFGTGGHTALWTAERALSAALLGIIPAALAFPSQGLDALLAVSVVMHQYWGLEAVVTDYVRPILFGNVIPKVAHGALLLISIATLGGLFYFIYNDIGIAKSIRKLWAIKSQ